MLENKKSVIQNVFVFFLIFGFPIISILNSVKVVLLYLVIILLLGINTKKVSNFVLSFDTSLFLFLYVFFLCFTLILTVVSGYLDFSLAYKILSSIFSILICYFFYFSSSDNINIPKVIYISFVVQALYIFMCIFSNTFYESTKMFRGKITEQHISAYGRLRGNAMSGYQFFGISTMFGFVIIWAFLNFSKKISFLCSFLLIMIAGVISGRFCIVAIGIGFAFFCINLLKEKKIKLFLLILFLVFAFIVIGIFACYKVYDSISDPVMKKVFNNYLMDPIRSIVEEHSFHSSSTDDLMNMYKIDLSDYYINGGGCYTTEGGEYFGKSDVGWHRVIFYYGIRGIVFLSLLYMLFIYFVVGKGNYLLKTAFFVYFIVLNFKGDVQIYSNNILPIIIGLLSFDSKSKKDDFDYKIKRNKSLKKYMFKLCVK